MIRILIGLVAGTAGGAVFWWLGLPVPWLTGSIVGGVAAMAASVAITVPRSLLTAAYIILGIQIGASVTPETFAGVMHWPLSMALLALTVIAVTAVCYRFYLGVTKWDRATALFSSLPGALSMTLILAQANRADMRRVTVAQCMRLIFIVAALPPLVTFVSPVIVLPPHASGSLFDIAIVLAASTAVALLFEKFRVPGGLFMGATFISAALYLGGVAHGDFPVVFFFAANVIFGVSLAERFQSFTLAELGASLREGFLGFLIALAISAAGAAIASFTGNLSFALTLLAFAPGGLDVMTIMAMALGLDPAYVGAHQIFRFLAMLVLTPVFTVWFFGRTPPD